MMSLEQIITSVNSLKFGQNDSRMFDDFRGLALRNEGGIEEDEPQYL